MSSLNVQNMDSQLWNMNWRNCDEVWRLITDIVILHQLRYKYAEFSSNSPSSQASDPLLNFNLRKIYWNGVF